MSIINGSSGIGAPLIDDPSASGSRRWEDSSQKVGASLDKAEQSLIEAFSFADEKDPKFKSLLKKLGLDAKTSLHGLQMIVQMRYDRAKQLFATLAQVLSGKHEAEQRVIDKIGR